MLDQLDGRESDAPPSGYPASAIMAPPFYDADFRYLDQTPLDQRRDFDPLKRMPLGTRALFSTGGETWIQFHHEINSRLTTTDQSYSLLRLRAYGDIRYGETIRVYGEFMTAGRAGGSLAPLPNDSDHLDLLNAFADVKVFSLRDHPVYVRAGRQEVLLGSQRLVSPLPWANARRTFDGVRLFRQGEHVDLDAFLVEPVTPNRTGFDRPNTRIQLAGAWLTYHPKPGRFVDAYWLFSNNDMNVVQQNITLAPSRSSTIGGRYAGDRGGALIWDLEGALQIGERGSRDLLAGMAVAGAGRRFAQLAWTPTVWAYYDYASGDSAPNNGRFTTFNPLFPFGHYYLGWADGVGRQNTHDANTHVGFYPLKWVAPWLQYHRFWLAEPRDALYNAGSTAIRRDRTGAAGRNVGDEIDAIVNVHVDAFSDVMVAFSKLFGGKFLAQTANSDAAGSMQSLYVIYNFRW
jgi:hypothetical protein